MVKSKDGVYQFAVKGISFETFFAEDGHVELYEANNPGKTGFIFEESKHLILFINNITDIAEMEMSEEE